jgi:hypothetical protein
LGSDGGDDAAAATAASRIASSAGGGGVQQLMPATATLSVAPAGALSVAAALLLAVGVVMLHAAGVGTAEGSVLIGGNSGAGKSSTALRCLAGGLNYFGDDICAISIQNGAPQIHSVYSSGKTLSNDLMKFPELLEYVHGQYDEEYEKEIFFFNTLVANKKNNNGNLKAIVIPHQNAELEIGFQKIPFARALSVICSSSKTLLPDGGNEIFQMLSAVIHHIPCYQFNLGNDPTLIPETLRKFITQLNENNQDDGR